MWHDNRVQPTWTCQLLRHISGLNRRLELRRVDSLQSGVGLALLLILRPLIAMRALWDSHPLPAFLVHWPQKVKHRYTSSAWHAEQLYHICSSQAHLRADIALSRGDCLARHHCTGESIRQELFAWNDRTQLLEEWQYETVDDMQSIDKSCDNRLQHRYHTECGLAGRNMYRIMHFTLDQTQRKLEEKLQKGSFQVLDCCIDRQCWEQDICASYSQAVGRLSGLAFVRPLFLSTYLMVWSLVFAARSMITGGQASEEEDSQFQWILQRLRQSSDEVGVAWADRMAASLAASLPASLAASMLGPYEERRVK